VVTERGTGLLLSRLLHQQSARLTMKRTNSKAMILRLTAAAAHLQTTVLHSARQLQDLSLQRKSSLQQGTSLQRPKGRQKLGSGTMHLQRAAICIVRLWFCQVCLVHLSPAAERKQSFKRRC
jgi:hypothetical protein